MNYFVGDRIMLTGSDGTRSEYELAQKDKYVYTLWNKSAASTITIPSSAQYPLAPDWEFDKGDFVYIKSTQWFSERGIDSIGSKMPLALSQAGLGFSVNSLIYELMGCNVQINSIDYGDMSALVVAPDDKYTYIWIPLYALTRHDPTFLTSFKDFITNYLSSVSDQFLETKGQTVFLDNGEEISCDYIFLNNDGIIVMKSNDRTIFPSSSRDEVLMAGIAKIVNDLKH